MANAGLNEAESMQLIDLLTRADTFQLCGAIVAAGRRRDVAEGLTAVAGLDTMARLLGFPLLEKMEDAIDAAKPADEPQLGRHELCCEMHNRHGQPREAGKQE